MATTAAAVPEPVVYLLHFDRPLAHAQHYVGIALDGTHSADWPNTSRATVHLWCAPLSRPASASTWCSACQVIAALSAACTTGTAVGSARSARRSAALTLASVACRVRHDEVRCGPLFPSGGSAMPPEQLH
jgi:hypothetical protein